MKDLKTIKNEIQARLWKSATLRTVKVYASHKVLNKYKSFQSYIGNVNYAKAVELLNDAFKKAAEELNTDIENIYIQNDSGYHSYFYTTRSETDDELIERIKYSVVAELETYKRTEKYKQDEIKRKEKRILELENELIRLKNEN